MKNLRILDAGAGIGRWTTQLAKHFPDVEITALDHKRRLPNIKGVKFIKGSIEDIPFENNYFDLVIASRVLPYVDLKTAIKELERVTKDGGIIVYELIRWGYYFKALLKGNLKRIINFINFWFYFNFDCRLFKKYDNIDSNLFLLTYSNYKITEKYLVMSWRDHPEISLTFMSNDKPLKEIHDKIKKIADDVKFDIT